MKKLVRYSLRSLVVIILLLLIAWVGIWAYIRYNKADLISKISSRITEKTRAENTIGDLSASLFKTFPFISLELSNIIVKDSLWKAHNKTFFSAKNIYLRLSPLGLFNKNRGIGKIIITNGRLHLFADSTDYNNQYILRSDKHKKKEEPSSIPEIELKNSELIFENPSRQKFHHFTLRELDINGTNNNHSETFDISTDMLVNSLSFNTEKGSYLKNKNVSGEFQVVIDRVKKKLSFSDIALLIDQEKFNLTGEFSVDSAQRDFILNISSKNLNFNKAVEMLQDSMRRKISPFTMEKPVAVQVNISGLTRYKFLPLVNIEMTVNDNTITTPGGTFTNCSFQAKFNNELATGNPRLDFNSLLEFINFSAQFKKIPFRSKHIKVSNLKNPYLECDLSSSFSLTALNELTGSTTLQFVKGNGDIDVFFKGPISGRDSVNAGINGAITIDNATVKYLPRNVTLSQCTGTFLFRDKDLLVKKLKARTGDTELMMNGDAKNFLSMLDISPEKLSLHWNVYSPQLHLKDFISFLNRRNIQTSQRAANDKVKQTAGKIDKMFTDGDVFITLTTPKMNYKKFDAKQVDAQVVLTSNTIDLRNVSFGHANGSMKMQGTVTEGVNSNAVFLNSTLNKMDIPILFHSFGDFGQDAITNKNLKGIISATVNVNTAITNQAEVIPESMSGSIDFLVENGELNHFEPLEKISASVFKKQDFSSIRFADLKNRLEVKGTAFIINKMEIRSTALILFAEGIYDVKKGTDMSIKFPIRNVLKKNDSIDLISSDINHGPSIRVRAKTGDDGKLKISWDPFRKAVRNKRDAEAN
ncbi:MAG: hypothetical protein H7122_14855 [Chitinophagaceae bacterium]|nr:hypothetical protein [Chitinophagaceae bacterium]